MNFQNKLKAFLVTLLRDHKRGNKIFSSWRENKLTSKQEFNSVLCSVQKFVVDFKSKTASDGSAIFTMFSFIVL